jgi:hypothetical protein
MEERGGERERGKREIQSERNAKCGEIFKSQVGFAFPPPFVNPLESFSFLLEFCEISIGLQIFFRIQSEESSQSLKSLQQTLHTVESKISQVSYSSNLRLICLFVDPILVSSSLQMEREKENREEESRKVGKTFQNMLSFDLSL